ncbi:MAG: protein kinase [Enhygromyxa sp.]
MAPAHRPDPASGRPERSDTGELLRDDTASLTCSGKRESLTMGSETGSGLETLASAGMSEMPALSPGEQIGAFKIERQIGSGGMGQVFAARRVSAGTRQVGEPALDESDRVGDQLPHNPPARTFLGSSSASGGRPRAGQLGDEGEIVALKYLERTSASMLYRFKQEFRALAGVTHENLVSLGELVALPELGTFFTMELIDGVAFDDYVRGRTPEGELPNLARLRRAFRQLVAGVRHLHRHGCIHRDLKPSNVLVTAEGRVVVLDFGLIQDHASEVADDPGEQIMGTPAYMSPEQAGLERAGPASDWYSVGVMLFECLTGKRPFRGTLTHLLFAKREFDPPDVAALVPEVPSELARLCQRLLARQPEQRPDAGEILAVLGGDLEDESGRRGASTGRGVFVGRQRELAGLEAAFAELGEQLELGGGRALTVFVHGRSGYGKSALIREFVGGLRERGEALVFEGRCLERESVPYKGLDPVVDALSVHLRQLPAESLAKLVPAHPGALIRLFPVLDELWSPDQLRALGRRLGRTGGLDAHELRQRAFAALRELLNKLARRRPLAARGAIPRAASLGLSAAGFVAETCSTPGTAAFRLRASDENPGARRHDGLHHGLLVITIDDFQWANVDSARLLNELLRPPDAPPMLVVISFRDEARHEEALEALSAPEALADRDVREIEVGPLAHDDARALASALMGEGLDAARAEAYAAGAEGSPFYLEQMVHGASIEGEGIREGEGESAGRLDQLVVRRILQLDPASRRLLEVVAVAGGPVDSEVAFAASELEDPEPLIPALGEAELLRSETRGAGVVLEIAHDRIREATVGELEPADLRATHLRLAVALECHGSDLEALAEHFERGGDRATAAEYYERAAEQAGNSLAFARAVALFRTTLELLPEDADPIRVADIRRGLAEQLINVGRGHEAAQLMLALAQGYEHPDQPEQRDAVRARELRRLAADQLIKTGHVEEGLLELDRLLRTVGLRLPASNAAAVSALLWEQARLRMRGFSFERRSASELPAELLDRIDTCFAVVNGLSTQETLLSALFHFRNLRLSLSAGEPRRVARALAYQCVIDVAGRNWKDVEQHFARARALAAELDDQQLEGFINLCDASVQWFERRHLISSVRHLEVIESLEGVAGAAWDRRTAQIHHMWTLLCQGRLREFWARARGTSERARERGDMQEMVEVSSYSAIALVLAGKPDEARRILAAAQAEWNPGRYLFGDVWACFARVHVLLHEAEPEQAIALVKQTLAQMKRTFLDQSAMARHNAEEHLCRSYLAAALLRDDPGHARRARKLAARLRAANNDVLTGQAAIVDAGLATLAGEPEAALRFWSEAATRLEAHGVQGHVAAICARKAAVLGDTPEGQALAARAHSYFEREGIEDVDGFLRTLTPAQMGKL